MEIEALRDRCAYWQKVLRLQDWEIKVEYVREKTMPQAWGTVSKRHIGHRMATIEVCDPSSFSLLDFPDNDVVSDPEYVLVHELLHIYTEGILKDHERETTEDIWAEQMADTVARALVKLDRARFGPLVTIPKNGHVEPEMTAAWAGTAGDN